MRTKHPLKISYTDKGGQLLVNHTQQTYAVLHEMDGHLMCSECDCGQYRRGVVVYGRIVAIYATDEYAMRENRKPPAMGWRLASELAKELDR